MLTGATFFAYRDRSPLLGSVGKLHLWLGILLEARNPYPKNPNPYPKNPNPKSPITISGSKLRYPKLLRVIRVLNPGTGNTRKPEVPRTKICLRSKFGPPQPNPCMATHLQRNPILFTVFFSQT